MGNTSNLTEKHDVKLYIDPLFNLLHTPNKEKTEEKRVCQKEKVKQFSQEKQLD
jgi:hypothetical protein